MRVSGWMKVALILPLAVALLFAIACSDIERNAYRAIAGMEVKFESAHQRVTEAAVHGLLSESQWVRFQIEAHGFIAAHNAAIDALRTYAREKSEEHRSKMDARIRLLPSELLRVETLIDGFSREPASPVIVPSEETLPQAIVMGVQ